MDPIRDIIARAGRRLLLAGWIRHAVVLLTVAAGLAVLARGAQKVAPVLVIDWAWVLPSLGVAAVVTGLVIAWVRRPKEIDIARTLDERAGLRETLSTALCVERDGGAWSRAIVDDAGQKAQRVVVRDAVPVEAPGNSWWPVAACAALLAVWWLPAKDLTGLLAKQEAAQEERRQVQEVAVQLDDAQKRIDEILAQTGVQLDRDGDDAEDPLLDPSRVERLSPEEMQRAAIKKLTDISDALQEKRTGEEGQTFDAIQDAMKRLETPGPGPAAEMSRAMARGDFAEAKKQLEELAAQIQSGEMSEEDKARLQEQVSKMAEALAQMAENRQQIEEQLQAAGMSEQQARQLASDPAAMEQALREAGMDQQQINRLAQQARAQQGACEAAGSMSQAMGEMAQGMEAGNESQAGEGMEAMSEQLSSLERMQAEMNALEQAMGQCQSSMAGMCENPSAGQGSMFGEGDPNAMFSQSASASRNPGSGAGYGQGQNDGTPPPAEFVLQREKANVPAAGDGPVIASTLVYGSQVRGESTAAFSEAASSAEAAAAEAIETKRVPREHEEAVKAYFGRLKKAAQENSGAPSDQPPAEQGKDAGN